MRVLGHVLLGGAAAAALIGGPGARAETLREAFVKVYNDNPTLSGARAGLRAIDEGVPLARSAGKPQISANVAYNEFVRRSANSFTSPERLLTVGPTVTMPIFQGGAVRNAVRAARSRVDAGRADLRTTEANIFVNTVSAYMDVIRDQSIVELNGNNVRVLDTNLQASRDRFEVGDLTRTDVAQSEARLAIARSQLQSVQAQLDASRENYLRIVGTFPATLEPPPPLPALPATPDDAVDVAVAANPAIEAAKADSRAADYDVGSARAARLPTISAFGSGEYNNYFNTLGGSSSAQFSQSEKTATVGVQLSVPIYQGGLPGARVRQAQARLGQALEGVTEVERAVVADTRTAYSRYQAALAVIQSSETAVSANELALEGVRAEQSVGTRNVLDVLNAEQELLNSRVTLVTARRDAYVQGFVLLAALGRAEAKDLGLDGGPLYDPVVNYRRVQGRINDWDEDPRPQPIASRTIAVPAVSAVVPIPQDAKPANSGAKAVPPSAIPVTSPQN